MNTGAHLCYLPKWPEGKSTDRLAKGTTEGQGKGLAMAIGRCQNWFTDRLQETWYRPSKNHRQLKIMT